ncbi:adenosine deaminase [Pseudoalteromonas sp. MMG013]|uniref:adenosine deaminase n=1 Tax=unclassified Pseudoalteromonas TaxID=194690 RepID=UPI001B3895DE|nr:MULTISPECIES: adenosine deaminase [unclassified Pseudoalteromonas]MBQ4846794.1 adenosine deaminase [Pseudoalteromonas sp. MMG005]MBQ4849677.1 adenosine deaminase [Pseudoalteromonas sp. MMG012]MBQ4860233.1 adenosine deaminase [Pseudoalteromonas sp. MMG013]
MKTLLSATVILTLSGCASVMTSDQQTINVTSSNNKAVEVRVDDKIITTPGTVIVLRDGKNKVAHSTSGNCDKSTVIDKKVTPVFFGNLLIGGVLGSTTDASTGKMWDYSDVEVQCNPE